MRKDSLTQAKLKELLAYDPETGFFTSSKTGKPYTRTKPNTYLYIRVHGKTYPASKLAWLYCYGYLSEKIIDHINRNKSDNRICNLREATASQNSHNKDNRPNKLGVSGVIATSSNPPMYIAKIVYAGMSLELGRFHSLDEAGKAYQSAKDRAFDDDRQRVHGKTDKVSRLDITPAERLHIQLASIPEQMEFVRTYKEKYPWMTRTQRIKIFGV